MLSDSLRADLARASLSGLDRIVQDAYAASVAGRLSDHDIHAIVEAVQARRRTIKGPNPHSALGVTAEASALPGGHQKTPPFFRPRKASPGRLQRSPDRQASITRRRQHALSGPLPPALRAGFTTGELAVLRIVADEVRQRGVCAMSLAEIAAKAGVCRTLAHATMRKAASAGLIAVEVGARIGPARNLPNRVQIVSAEWKAWLARGQVFRKTSPTDDKSLPLPLSAPKSAQPSWRKGYRGEKAEPDRLHRASL